MKENPPLTQTKDHHALFVAKSSNEYPEWPTPSSHARRTSTAVGARVVELAEPEPTAADPWTVLGTGPASCSSASCLSSYDGALVRASVTSTTLKVTAAMLPDFVQRLDA